MNIIKTYLTEAYAIDNKSILRILTQDKQINKADPKYSYYEKLANWANSNGRQQKLKNVDLNSIELSDRGLIAKNKMITKYTTLGHVLLALKNLMDQEGHYNPESALSRLIQLTTLEILGGLSGIKDPKKSNPKPDPDPDPEPDPKSDPEPEPGQETKAGAGRDWTAYKAKKLANANGKPTSEVLKDFYDEYYSVEYAGINPAKEQEIVAKLKSLDKILIPEFNKLGYNPEVNPFAQFLKNLIKNKYEIFEKLTFNTYGAIHNSFIDKKITGNMLGKYDEYKNKNILFCSDLYNYKGLDIVEYLSLQKQTLDKLEGSDNKYSNVENLIAKMFIQQEDKGDSYKEKINYLLYQLPKVALPGKSEDKPKLRSELEIKELYNYLFGAMPEDSTKIDEIVNKAVSNKVVLDMIHSVVRHIRVKDNYKTAVDNWLKEAGYKQDDTRSTTSEQILLNYEVSVDEAKSIVTKLIMHHNKAINKKAGTT